MKSGTIELGVMMSDPSLFGHNSDKCMVAADLVENKGKPDEMVLFFRAGNETVRTVESFSPFLLADERALSDRGCRIADCPVPFKRVELLGPGNLNVKLSFASWKDCVKAGKWLAKSSGLSPNAPTAPWLFINDPTRQHLTTTGRTLFKGMKFEQIRRLQLDIECMVSDGYEFCNAEREGDRIIAVGAADETGNVEVIDGGRMGEKELLQRLVALVRDRDPDVIEGHNIFNFDLPYIVTRAKMHGVKLPLGRDGSPPAGRPSRLAIGERTVPYTRFEIFGRHVADTLFLAQAYDLAERSLEGFGLKEVAVHFGVAAKDRTYIDGSEITAAFKKDPASVMRYVSDDAAETRAVSDILSVGCFVQASMLPYSYQNVCVRGNATKIDALMLREYLRQGHAVPLPGAPRDFAGGYTDIFIRGVVNNVHHCDVRSLYPSLMLSENITPRSDELGVFHAMLRSLRAYRMEAKAKAEQSRSLNESHYFGALQQTFKVFINSFYGYMGSPQARFGDFGAAEQVAARGRDLLHAMIETLRNMGATPVEIDTDGIYFVPPAIEAGGALEKLRSAFRKTLPPGIEVEFDGEYKAMYSYKMKNYALLCSNGDVVIRGAALKSRGLERFQRAFLKRILRLKLEGKDDAIPAMKDECARAIAERKWPISEFGKTVTLQDSPATYAEKVAKKLRARDAAYELALRSGREYRAGDQLTFYVTGDKKNVAAYANAKPVSDWNQANRDENIQYYLGKLEALYDKFMGEQAEDEESE